MRLALASGAATAAVTVTLYPLFKGGSWLVAGLGVIVAITAMGALTSRYALPPWLVPPAGLATLWIFLTAVFAGDVAWWRVLPTTESVIMLGELMRQGFADIQRYAAPVPTTPGITLLTAGGVGVIAILADLFAVRLRKAALAGLPLLTLFIVPAEIIAEPIGWPAFIVAALGYTGLLAADGRERIGRWGRAVLLRRTRGGDRLAPDASHVRLSGRRVGVTAIALAILLPALLPTLEPNSLFAFGVGGSGRSGGNTISIPNPIVSLKGQLTLPRNATVLTYASSDKSPRYLRLWSLDVFTGEQWTMTPPTGKPEDRVENGPLPPPPGMLPGVPTTRSELEIQISEGIDDLQFLPLPYPSTEVEAEGDWRADISTLMVFSTRDYADGLSYRVITEQPKPTPAMLKAAPEPDREVAYRYLRLPRDIPPEIRRLARRVTRDQETPYEQAVRLQEWFTVDGGFTYDLQTEGHGNSALVDFLLHGKAGYCEQFAASMAVMARILGIPARVAIGYTGGTSVADGQWRVGTHDMHAWPELYFEGVGWLAFEPTPTGGLGQGTARVPDYSLPSADDPDADDDADDSSATGGAGNDDTEGAGAPRNPRLLDREAALGPVDVPEEGTPLLAWVAYWAGMALIILLVPAVLRVVVRGGRLRAVALPSIEAHTFEHGATGAARIRADRRAASVSAAWAELDDALYDYGMSREDSETPRALARRLIAQYGFDEEQAAAMNRLASATERLLFARTPGDIGSLAADLRVVRRALAATVPRGRRVRAAVMPPSALRRLRRVGGKLLDGFDGLENFRLRKPARRGG